MMYLDSYFRLVERTAAVPSLETSYSWALVLLSVTISTIASLVAMVVVERVRSSTNLLARSLLIGLGGLALGVGIWAMHFIGMLAFDMTMSVGYDPEVTIISVIPGLIAGTIAIAILGKDETPGIWQIIVAGVIVGAGIGAMHYTGMAAMTMGAELLYDIPLVLLSVVVAATLATTSLFALFFLRRSPRLYQARLPISALIMGCAVAGMHYTAMAAAVFVPMCGGDTFDDVGINASVLTILITVFVAFLFSDVFAVVFASQQMQTKRSLEQEIVNREAAETAALTEKARLRTIFENAADGIIIFDAAGNIREWNIAAARIFSYGPEYLAGKNIADLFIDQKQGRGENDALESGGKLTGIRSDNSHFPADLSIGEAMEAGARIRIGLVRDLSERARAESQLNAALDSMSGGLLVLGPDMCISICNDRFRELYDLPLETCSAGTRWSETVLYRAARGDFGAGDPEQLTQDSLDRIKSANPYRKVSTIKGGRVVEAHWSQIAGGGFVAIATDITEATELTTALQRAQTQAEAANEAKSRFLATMSHEIRTPMNAIIGMIDVMREGELNKDQREIADVIRDSSFSLLQIINDILDFSKIEATGVELDRSPVSVLQIAEGVCDAMAWTARQKGVRLVLSYDNFDLRPIYGDALRLRQILLNLIGNAVKFTETTSEKTGIVRLTMNTHAAAEGRQRIRLQISDNGIGISEEAREALFLPFSQAESSTTRKYGGTGLGLSIVMKLIRAMGGTVELKSKIGHGSTFIVEFTADIAPKGSLAEIDIPDLQGVQAWVAVGNLETRDTSLKVLKLIGAKASSLPVKDAANYITAPLSSNPDAERPLSIVILDDETQSLRAGLRRMAAEKNLALRYVRISAERRDDDNTTQDTVTIDAHPLRVTALARAAAIAAGQSSPPPAPITGREGGVGGHRQSREEALAAGTLVLVVEDNLNNQQVIMRQLSLLGYTCDIASNGAEALTLLSSWNYGIVLTDCHMPVMDGFELTRQIRRAEQGTDRHQKIVAITANALQGEAEHCLASGMDFYLPKPLELSKLAEALKAWLPLPQKFVTAVETAPAAQDDTSSAMNIAAIAELYGSSDPNIIAESLRDFLELAPADAAAFSAALARNERSTLRDLSHRLKSTAKSVGAFDLARVCEAAEAKAMTASDDEARTIFSAVETEFQRTHQAVKSYLARGAMADA